MGVETAVITGAEAVAQALANLPLAKIAQNADVVIALLSQVGQALPAIEKGIVSAEPYIAAIGTVLMGNTPTDEQWAALDAGLDANSDAIETAAEEPDPNAPPADAGGNAGNGEPGGAGDQKVG